MAFERNRFFDLRRGIILVQAYVYKVNNLYKLNPEKLTFSTTQRVSYRYKIPYIFLLRSSHFLEKIRKKRLKSNFKKK